MKKYLLFFLLTFYACIDRGPDYPTCSIIEPDNGSVYSKGDTIHIEVDSYYEWYGDIKPDDIILRFNNQVIDTFSGGQFTYDLATNNYEPGEYKIEAILSVTQNANYRSSDLVRVKITSSVENKLVDYDGNF